MLLGSSAEAEDAVHDSFVQAWLHWGDLRDSSRIDAWFDRILINVCRGRLRRRKVRPLELGESNAGCAQDLYAAVHERNALGQALAGLKPNHRVVIFLRYYADLTPREIAWRTGEREGTVKSRLHYGLRQLRAAIESGER
jgi:RNA polymerase sigma-70 factor (ECF subfamily)